MRFFLLFILLFSSWARAEPYLVVRPSESLEPGQSLGPFVGTWDRALIELGADGLVQVLTREEAADLYDSFEAAQSLAESNTRAMAETLTLDNQGEVAQFLAEPLPAVSGILLFEDVLRAQMQALGISDIRFILPFDELLVAQLSFNANLDTSVQGYADQVSQAHPAGLDSQVIAFGADGYSVAMAPITPPEIKEVDMTIAPDPENTLVITLEGGDVLIRLREDAAPNHVARIKELAREGFYDGIVFHRVIEGFMAQTGDPTGTGTSGSGVNLNAEFSDLPFERGTVGMARAASPNSADSQFFIMFDQGSFLNGNYTVIGQVIEGMEYVDEITRGEPPANPDQMLRVQVQADL